MTPCISIVIPIYKAEEYLNRCLDSILAQTFKDWELILVDDGSPDSSGVICDEYAKVDRRIKVFHKDNGGVSSAREIGIQNALGYYSIHIDPDDWIEPDTLLSLYSVATTNDADIVICDFLLDYGGTHQEISHQSIEDGVSYLQLLFTQKRHGSLCNKLIKTELYKKYNLHFPCEMICWEDLFICCNILLNKCKLSYVPRAFYHYDLHTNGGSMTRKATSSTLTSMKYFITYFDNRLSKEQKLWLYDVKAMVLVTAYRCNLLKEDELRNLYPEIHEWFISQYLKQYNLVIFCATAQVLAGKSMKYARRFQGFNVLYQRFVDKVKRVLKY